MPLPIVPASSLTPTGFKTGNAPTTSNPSATPKAPTVTQPTAPATVPAPVTTTPAAKTPAPATQATPTGQETKPQTQPAGTVVNQGGTQMVVGTDGNAKPAYNTYYQYTDPATGKISYTNFAGQPVQNDPTSAGTNTNVQVIPTTQPPVAGQTPSTTPALGAGTGNPTVDALNSAISNETSSFNQALSALNDKSDAAFNDLESKVSQAENGTLPLTPAQQSQLDAFNQQTQQLRQQQIIANSTYQNGVLLNEYLTGQAAPGEISGISDLNNAVNLGMQKLQDIDAKAAATLSSMEEGFNTDNLKIVQDAYDAFNKYMGEKEAALKDMQSATVAVQQKLADQIITTTQNNITNILNSDKFTYQQKDDAIKNQLAQAQLDEKTKVDMETLKQKQEALDLQYQANAMLQGAYSNQALQGIAQTLPDGSPNPKYQDTLLSTLPPATQNLIKGIADYSIDPHSLTTSSRQALGSLTQAQAIAMAKQYDPSYSEGQYAIRNAFMKNWEVGGQNSVIQAANTSIDHLSKLYTESQNLGNIPSGSLGPFTGGANDLNQWLNKGNQNATLFKFKQDALALAGEQARIYKNGTGSSAAPGEDEIAAQLNILTAGLAPDTAKAVIQNGIGLMTDRLTSATENYQSVMGKPPSSILYSTALGNIQTLESQGFTIDTNALDPSPYKTMSTNDFLSSIGGTGTSTQSTSDFFSAFASNASSAANIANQ